MRRVPFFPMLITVLVSLGGYLGCQPPQQIVQEVEQQVGQQINNQLGGAIERATGGALSGLPVSTGRSVPLTNTPVMQLPDRVQGNLIIGSFNIQRLGPSKLSDPNLMRVYADIIRRFDVLALQEVTSEDQNTIPTLLSYVNEGGRYRYGYTISSRIGRKYFEQYVFLFDTNRVISQQNACFVMRDENDLLHREPFVGRFTTLTPNPFTFALINMHTDPDVVNEELNTLANVYVNVANYFYQGNPPEDDVILLGDLNADPTRFQGLGQIPNLIPTIVGIPTNYTRSKTNDNILINRLATREYTGRAGAIDLGNAYQLDKAQTLKISDHQPIWAEFTIQEAHDQQIASPGSVSWAR